MNRCNRILERLRLSHMQVLFLLRTALSTLVNALTARRKASWHGEKRILQPSRYPWMSLLFFAPVGIVAAFQERCEETCLTGLAKDYCDSDLIASLIVEDSPDLERKTNRLTWIKSHEVHRARAADVVRLVPRVGRWVVFATERESQIHLRRLIREDPDCVLTQYILGIRKHLDVAGVMPIGFYYHHLKSGNPEVARDALCGCLSFPLRAVESFASNELSVQMVAMRLGNRSQLDADSVRLYSVLLAHAEGDEDIKTAILDEAVSTAKKTTLLSQLLPTDGILSGLIACSKDLGATRLREILSDPDVPRILRQAALRSANYAIERGYFDARTFGQFIRAHLDLLYAVHPEVLHLAHAHGMSLTADDVAEMATHPRVLGDEEARFASHRAIAGYYLMSVDTMWQREVLRQIALRDQEALRSVKLRIARREGQSGVPSSYLGTDIHRPENGGACYFEGIGE